MNRANATKKSHLLFFRTVVYLCMKEQVEFLEVVEGAGPNEPDCFINLPDGTRLPFMMPAKDVLRFQRAIQLGAGVEQIKRMLRDAKYNKNEHLESGEGAFLCTQRARPKRGTGERSEP